MDPNIITALNQFARMVPMFQQSQQQQMMPAAGPGMKSMPSTTKGAAPGGMDINQLLAQIFGGDVKMGMSQQGVPAAAAAPPLPFNPYTYGQFGGEHLFKTAGGGQPLSIAGEIGGGVPEQPVAPVAPVNPWSRPAYGRRQRLGDGRG